MIETIPFVSFENRNYLVKKAGRGLFVYSVLEPVCNRIKTEIVYEVIAWPHNPFIKKATK